MPIEIIPACDVPLADQARLFNDAFKGYVGGSLALDAAGLARFLSLQGADLFFSRFARNTDGLAGFGYVTRVGGISRLACMGVAAKARRSGVGRQILLCLLEEAKARGDRMMVLEVIQQNPAANALYRNERFREVARLPSWRRAPDAPPLPSSVRTTSRLEEIPTLAASQWPSGMDFPELPWQVSRHAVLKRLHCRAFACGRSLVVIEDPSAAGPIRTVGLFSSKLGRTDWARLRATLAAVIHSFAGREFVAPPLFPEQFGEEIFAPLGFQRDQLTQFLLTHDLIARTSRGRRRTRSQPFGIKNG